MSIRVEGLSHTCPRGIDAGKTILHGVTFTIEAGQCVGIAGGAGSGKTALLEHLNGLMQPSAGRVSVVGADGVERDRNELRQLVGMVFQYPEQQLFAENVYREIAYGLTCAGINAAEIDQRVRESLQLVGLEKELLPRSPFELSGGQKRRVAMAGVLAMRPEILLLDEPAAGLDPQGRREILDSIAKIHRELGLTLVLASHNLEDIARLADRVVVLINGTVALQGSTRAVFRDAVVLAGAGLELPQITAFMSSLRELQPELPECVLTVEEARDELKRLMAVQQAREELPC